MLIPTVSATKSAAKQAEIETIKAKIDSGVREWYVRLPNDESKILSHLYVEDYTSLTVCLRYPGYHSKNCGDRYLWDDVVFIEPVLIK